MLGDFLLREIDRRGMSIREFARFVGLSHQVVSKFLEYGKKDVGYPSMEFVIKLAKALDKNVGDILVLIDPTLESIGTNTEPQSLDVQTRIHAERYQELTPKQRRLVDAFMRTLVEVDNEG